MARILSKTLPVVLALWVIAPPLAISGEIESGVREIKRGQDKDNFEQVVDGLENIAYRFKDLLIMRSPTASKIVAASDEIITAMKVYNEDPLVLEDITASIVKDTQKIEAKRPPDAKVDNPFDERIESKLASSTPTVRREALNELRTKIGGQKKQLTENIASATSAQAEAKSLISEAEDTSQRGIAIEKVLQEAFESPGGGILTTASSKFGFIFLDMAIHVNPALSGRVSAARHYLKRCDAALTLLQDKMAELENFEQWVGYYQWELGMRFPSSEFEKGLALLNDLDRLQGKRVDQQSTEALRIEKLIDITTRETKASRQQAESLVAYARFKDENIARIEAFSNLYNLGASMATLGANGSDTPTKRQEQTSAAKAILSEFETISQQKPTIIGPGLPARPLVNRATPTTPPPVIPTGAMRMHP